MCPFRHLVRSGYCQLAAIEPLEALLKKYSAAVIWASKKNVLAPSLKHEVKLK